MLLLETRAGLCREPPPCDPRTFSGIPATAASPISSESKRLRRRFFLPCLRKGSLQGTPCSRSPSATQQGHKDKNLNLSCHEMLTETDHGAKTKSPSPGPACRNHEVITMATTAHQSILDTVDADHTSMVCKWLLPFRNHGLWKCFGGWPNNCEHKACCRMTNRWGICVRLTPRQ